MFVQCLKTFDGLDMSAQELSGAELALTKPMVVKGVTVYKVLAGDTTLASYNEGSPPSAHDDLDGDGSQQLKDWRGLYTQFQRDHVLGTVPYRWEKGHSEARLVSVTFEELEIVVFQDDRLHDAGMSGEQKATMVKQKLGILEEEPLLVALGKRRQVALVRETESEWELIVPHDLLPTLPFQERGIARFRRHPERPVISHWSHEMSDMSGDMCLSWQSGDDLTQLESFLPDLDMSWLDGSQR